MIANTAGGVPRRSVDGRDLGFATLHPVGERVDEPLPDLAVLLVLRQSLRQGQDALASLAALLDLLLPPEFRLGRIVAVERRQIVDPVRALHQKTTDVAQHQPEDVLRERQTLLLRAELDEHARVAAEPVLDIRQLEDEAVFDRVVEQRCADDGDVAATQPDEQDGERLRVFEVASAALALLRKVTVLGQAVGLHDLALFARQEVQANQVFETLSVKHLHEGFRGVSAMDTASHFVLLSTESGESRMFEELFIG